MIHENRATPWSTQLVLSINMKFFGDPCKTKAMTTETIPKPGLFNYTDLLPFAPVLPLVKPKAHVSVPVMVLGSLDQFISNKSLCFSQFLVSVIRVSGQVVEPCLLEARL